MTMTTAPRTDVIPDAERPEQLVVVRQPGPSMLERWVDGPEPEKNLARVDAMARMLERLRLTAIQQTYATDWVIHSTRDRETGDVTKQVGYLQDSGAERAGKVFGITIGAPAVEREDMPDGSFAYKLQAEAMSQVTHERIEHCLGSRWSGDDFFTRGLKEGEKVDPTDVMKAAYANLHGRAVRALAGLSAVPLDAIKAAGVDTKGCTFVAYNTGSRGGTSTGASQGSADVTVAFGRSANKKPVELGEKDLDWYIKAYTENVADESKAKFKAKNEVILHALKAEKEKRALGDKHEAETGTTAADLGPTLGSKKATLHTLFSDAVKAETRAIGPLVRAVTKELLGQECATADLTEAQVDTLLKVDAATLEATATALAKAAKK